MLVVLVLVLVLLVLVLLPSFEWGVKVGHTIPPRVIISSKKCGGVSYQQKDTSRVSATTDDEHV